ncbi:MAG: 6-bladed beta-propeller [Paramuribaculum sp.]|nr:6-bladed beta-propeller [Paramuribaculum sp.]
MYKIIKILIILIGLVPVSCSKKQDSGTKAEKEFIFSLNDTDTLINSITCDYLQLEETPESLLGSIGSIIEVDGKLILSDDKEYVIYAFDINGKFLSRIGNRGQGVGEYVSPSAFFVDSINKEIGVYDEEQNKVIYYNLYSYEYIKEQSFEDILSNCCVPYESGLLWYNQSYEGRTADKYFVSTDSEGVIDGAYVDKIFKSGYSTGASNHVYSLDGHVYGYTPYAMTVYEFENGKVVPSFEITIEGFSTPTIDFLNNISNGGMSNTLFSGLSKSDFISWYSILDTRNLLCISVIRQKIRYLGFVDKSTKGTLFMLQDEFTRKTGIGRISYSIPGSIDGKVLMATDKEKLEVAVEEGIILDSRLKEILMTNNENPIIVKIGIKDI